jgi:amphiphysin
VEEAAPVAAAGGQQCRALFDYAGEVEGDLPFKEGDVINVVDTSDPSGWWVGELNGVQGNFPSNFVELI